MGVCLCEGGAGWELQIEGLPWWLSPCSPCPANHLPLCSHFFSQAAPRSPPLSPSQADIFSFGILAWELLAYKRPFHDFRGAPVVLAYQVCEGPGA